jgi:hypothetical protein
MTTQDTPHSKDFSKAFPKEVDVFIEFQDNDIESIRVINGTNLTKAIINESASDQAQFGKGYRMHHVKKTIEEDGILSENQNISMPTNHEAETLWAALSPESRKNLDTWIRQNIEIETVCCEKRELLLNDSEHNFHSNAIPEYIPGATIRTYDSIHKPSFYCEICDEWSQTETENPIALDILKHILKVHNLNNNKNSNLSFEKKNLPVFPSPDTEDYIRIRILPPNPEDRDYDVNISIINIEQVIDEIINNIYPNDEPINISLCDHSGNVKGLYSFLEKYERNNDHPIIDIDIWNLWGDRGDKFFSDFVACCKDHPYSDILHFSVISYPTTADYMRENYPILYEELDNANAHWCFPADKFLESKENIKLVGRDELLEWEIQH